MMHQRISKKIIIYLFIFLTLGTITTTKVSNNFYKVIDLKINGLNPDEANKIYKDLEHFKNENIFLLDKKNISEMINLNKTVEQFKIFKNYPSSLNIEIKKTEILAITKKNNIDYLIGSNGNLIKVNDNTIERPFIFGNIDIKNFLNFKKKIDKSNFRFNDIKDLYYFKSNRWDVIFKDGTTIKMPLNLTLEKLNLIFTIIQNNYFDNKKIIDFRQSNMMVING